jgi:hypothetical protein
MSELRTYQGPSTIMRKTLHWRYKIMNSIMWGHSSEQLKKPVICSNSLVRMTDVYNSGVCLITARTLSYVK